MECNTTEYNEMKCDAVLAFTIAMAMTEYESIYLPTPNQWTLPR